jgi:hypothetical protein
VLIPPNTAVTENIVFPPTGGTWEIACEQAFVTQSIGSRIIGTVTCDCTAGLSSFRLTNLAVVGAISGAQSGTAAVGELMLTRVRHAGNLTLTNTVGSWLMLFQGWGPPSANKTGGSSTGTVSISTAIIQADSWVFEGNITEGAGVGPFNPPPGSSWRGCQFGANTGSATTITLNGGAGNCSFYDCFTNGPVTLACAANYVVNIDGATMASFLQLGCTQTGAGARCVTINANASSTTTEANNRASTNLGARAVTGLYELVFSDTVLVAGSVGALQVNVIYTDMTGTLVTVAVGGTLNIAGAVGSKQQGSIQFQHNGAAAPIAFSTTGVVTPGTMSVALAVALRKVN